MPVSREVKESPLHQGADEQMIYTLTTTPWASTPTSPSMVVKDLTTGGTDVTSTVTSGSITTSDNVLTLKTIKSLTAGHNYQMEVKFTAGGSIWEAYCLIMAQT